jgi:RimJ/RimL family protein N-acetyltransferase
MKKPTLTGPRLTLRPLKLSDAPNYVRWLNDRQVIRYVKNQGGMTLANEKRYIRAIAKDKNKINLSMVNEEGKHIGGAGVVLAPEHKRATFGIVIGDKTQWGKKYAQEATAIFIDYVFRKLKYNRLELEVWGGNVVAQHVYEKLGFVKEGTRRKYIINKITKKFEDETDMAILREDWLKMKGAKKRKR